MILENSNKSKSEKLMFYFGLPVALLVFATIFTIPTPSGITYGGKVSMAVFAAALILWVSESVPTYLTSLLVIALLSVFGGWGEKNVLGVFGYNVIWLMVSAFIITSAMEKSGFARRLALWIITKFGKTSKTILISLLVTNFFIAFIVPSTTARAAIMLPIVLLIAEAYGVYDGNKNLGKLLSIQGLQANNISTSAIVTATAPQILAIGFIKELTGHDVSWMQWFVASVPIAILTLISSYFLGLKLFKLETVDTKNANESIGSIEREYKNLGKMSRIEIKSLCIFALTIFLWSTDKWHLQMFGFKISLVMVAIIAAILFFFPYIGILNWKEAKIPWDLMIFSAGAYAGGISLNDSGVAPWVLNGIFDKIGVENMSFPVLYGVVIFIASFSHFVFTSKTVRTVILVPTIITLANAVGINPVALVLPACFTIADTITLPPHCKPNLIYYSTGLFTVSNQLIYGVLVLLAKWVFLFAASFTWFKILGIV